MKCSTMPQYLASFFIIIIIILLGSESTWSTHMDENDIDALGKNLPYLSWLAEYIWKLHLNPIYFLALCLD